MKDKFNNIYEFVNKPNGHRLVTGKSGYGKSYHLCQEIKQLWESGKKVVVVDFSGSFTEEQRRIQGIQDVVVKEFTSANSKKIPYFLPETRVRDSRELADLILETCGVRSAYKKDTIKNMVTSMGPNFDFEWLYIWLREMCEGDEEDEDEDESVKLKIKKKKRNPEIESLLTQVSDLLEEPVMEFTERNASLDNISDSSKVEVYQLSDTSHNKRKCWISFIVGMIWILAKHGKCPCDYLVIDEIQHLKITDNSAAGCLLREGRKFGVGMILSTQFVSSLDKTARLSLEQVAQKIYLHPADEDLKYMAKELEISGFSESYWKKELKNLKVGEAVIQGSFRVNSNDEMFESVIKLKL